MALRSLMGLLRDPTIAIIGFFILDKQETFITLNQALNKVFFFSDTGYLSHHFDKWKKLNEESSN